MVNATSPPASVVWKPRRNVWPTVLPPRSATSEYTPAASQCQTSTTAPGSGVQAPAASRETRSVIRRGAPGRRVPSAGSERMSERSSLTSTKYGPSVRAGRTTHTPGAAADAEAPAPSAHAAGEASRRPPASPASPPAPRSARARRRVSTRPIVASSPAIRAA